MDDLIARLEAATEGSFPLDLEVLCACGWTLARQDFGGECMQDPEGMLQLATPSPTRSVDDALALVPAGGAWSASKRRGKGKELYDVELVDCEGWSVGEACASTLPLTITIAALKARVAS